MIRIASKREGFRRCGVAHSMAPKDWPDDRFSEQELKLLEDEPMLVVQVLQADKDQGSVQADTQAGNTQATDSDKESALIAAVAKAVEDGQTTTSGAPKVEALEEILGFDVSSAERDAAWAAWKGENA